jgi:RNA polymerase sigma factor (sigma-70 family)
LGINKETIYRELLVLRCRRGDRSAWKDLIDHWDRRLFYYVQRIVADEQDAWDVLQQTWLATFNAIGTIRDGRALPKWLYRTARNLALMQLRRKNSCALQDAVHEPEGAETSAHEDENGPLQFERADLLHHALDQIPLPLREVLRLHFLRDLSIEEVAGVIGIPSGTVKSRLYYAKRAIRSVLERGG